MVRAWLPRCQLRSGSLLSPRRGRLAVNISQVTFITYDPGGSGDQHVAMWPPGREFIRRASSPTSVGDPEPVSGIIQLG
jgi:hypothetical protein